MSSSSKIEWTDATWNPVRGAPRSAPGCKHCYAETFAERFRGVPGHPYEQGFDLRLVPEKLAEPLRWKTPKSDLRQLHERPVPRGRAGRLRRRGRSSDAARRLAHLSGADQALGAVAGSARDEAPLRRATCRTSGGASASRTEARLAADRRICGRRRPRCGSCPSSRCWKTSGRSTSTGIHWVIVGGESGHGARPMDEEWVVAIRDQCSAAGCRSSSSNGAASGRARTGREFGGRTYDEFPQRLSTPPMLETRSTAFSALKQFESNRTSYSGVDSWSHELIRLAR